MGGSDRARRGVGAVVVVLVLATAGGACSDDGGDESSTSTTSTTRPDRPPTGGATAEPGVLDGRDLPVPASELRAFGGRVVYYAATGSDGGVEVVAVDPEAGEVAWRRPVGLSNQAPGVVLWVGGAGEHPVVLAPSGDRVVALDVEGREVWNTEVGPAENLPGSCGAGQVCVTTDDGVVMIDAETGDASPVAPATAEHRLIVGDGAGAKLGVLEAESVAEPAVEVAAFAENGAAELWSAPTVALFGAVPVTSRSGWWGRDYDGTWILSLGRTYISPGVPAAGFEFASGATAAFTPSGTSLWTRPDEEPCMPLASPTVLVMCSGTTRVVSPDEVEHPLSSFEQVDPSTGEVLLAHELAEPLDLTDMGTRLLAMGQDRWLLRDGEETVVVDFARSEVRAPTEAETVGWCVSESDPTEELLRPSGEAVPNAGPKGLFPCSAQAGDDDGVEEGRQAVVDGTLTVPDDDTVAAVDDWVVWIEDGSLTGVRVSG